MWLNSFELFMSRWKGTRNTTHPPADTDILLKKEDKLLWLWLLLSLLSTYNIFYRNDFPFSCLLLLDKGTSHNSHSLIFFSFFFTVNINEKKEIEKENL